MSTARIVRNRLLGGWFVVRGPHDTPISGRFDTRAEAQAHLRRDAPKPEPERYISDVIRIGRNTFYRNKRGRCEDAPCCGCCTI